MLLLLLLLLYHTILMRRMHLMRAKLLLNAILWDKISKSLSSRSSKHCKCVCECVHKHITFQSGKKLFEKIMKKPGEEERSEQQMYLISSPILYFNSVE